MPPHMTKSAPPPKALAASPGLVMPPSGVRGRIGQALLGVEGMFGSLGVGVRNGGRLGRVAR
eukprot:scaffold28625_cov73-Isochrysis_galbana.AAC.1